MDRLLKGLLNYSDLLMPQSESDGIGMVDLTTQVAEKLIKDLRRYYNQVQDNAKLKTKLMLTRVYEKLKSIIKPYAQQQPQFNLPSMLQNTFTDKNSFDGISFLSKDPHFSMMNSIDMRNIGAELTNQIKVEIQNCVSHFYYPS